MKLHAYSLSQGLMVWSQATRPSGNHRAAGNARSRAHASARRRAVVSARLAARACAAAAGTGERLAGVRCDEPQALERAAAPRRGWVAFQTGPG
jgi:hypothetical protein